MLVLEYLTRCPSNFPWWHCLQRLSLGELQEYDTEESIKYIINFLKLVRNLRHFELLCSQQPGQILKELPDDFCQEVTLVLPFDQDALKLMLAELTRMSVHHLHILG